MRSHTRKHRGQALVEFTLTITLLFTLLSAVIDAGLAFFAYQGLAGAAQEGSAYAAFSPVVGSGGSPIVNDVEIRSRVRNEAGVVGEDFPNRARFVRLHDLNNDKTDDSAQAAILTSYIIIKTVPNSSNPINATTGISRIPCNDTTPQRTAQFCDMQVQVKYLYKPFFSAAGLLGAGQITLSATRQATISR